MLSYNVSECAETKDEREFGRGGQRRLCTHSHTVFLLEPDQFVYQEKIRQADGSPRYGIFFKISFCMVLRREVQVRSELNARKHWIIGLEILITKTVRKCFDIF